MLTSFKVSNFLSFNETEEVTFTSSEDPIGRTTLIFGPNGAGKTNLVLAFVYCFRKMGYYDFGMDHFIKDGDLKRIEGKVYAEDSEEYEMTTFVLKAKNGLMHIYYEFSVLSETEEICYENIRIGTSDNGSELFSLIRDVMDYKEHGADGTFHEGVLDDSMACQTMISKPFELFSTTMARLSFSGMTIATYDFDINVISTINSELNKKVMVSPGILDRVSDGLNEIAGFRIGILRTEQCESKECSFYFDHGIHYIEKGQKLELVFFEEGFERGRCYEELSSGTKRILNLLLMVESVANQYRIYDNCSDEDIPSEADIHPMCVLVVDEVGYSLHPIVLRRFIDYIDSAYKFLPLQLLFTVHNTEMIAFENVSYNQIYLIDKDEKGSYIRNLEDISGIEMCGHGSDLKNAYLEGRLGSIPKFRNYRRMADDS